MARAPNKKVTEAYKLYKKNYKMIDIANELAIPASTIRRWKKTYSWDNERSELNSERSELNISSKKIKNKATVQDVENIIENTELTDKQRLFCIYYIKYFNAVKAYRKAYEVDYNTATSIAYRLMENDGVKKEILRLKKDKLNKVMLSEDDIFQKYIDIAFSDITDFMTFGTKTEVMLDADGVEMYDDEGNIKTYTYSYAEFLDHTEVDGTIISEVSKGKDGAKIKLQDKMKALAWLGDRMDLLSTETKTKLENEKSKLELNVMKLELEVLKHGGQDEEVEDDGFMDAMNSQVGAVWDDD